MNGEGVKEFNHDLEALFEGASKIDSSIKYIDILPHQSIQIDEKVSHFLKKFSIKEFIVEIKKHGSADNRYNTFGVEYNTGHICAMDSLLFKLRKMICVPPISESYQKLSSDMILIFEKNNPWFQTEANKLINRIPSEQFNIKYTSSVTTFDFLIKNKNDTACKITLQWLKSKMQLPKKNSKS